MKPKPEKIEVVGNVFQGEIQDNNLRYLLSNVAESLDKLANQYMVMGWELKAEELRRDAKEYREKHSK